MCKFDSMKKEKEMNNDTDRQEVFPFENAAF